MSQEHHSHNEVDEATQSTTTPDVQPAPMTKENQDHVTALLQLYRELAHEHQILISCIIH